MSSGTDERGIAPALAAIMLVVGLAAVAVVGGAVLTGPPDGEAILDSVEDRYESADALTGQAEVRATNGSATRTASVSFAFADPESARVSVEYDDRTYVAGTNGTVAWVSVPELGIARSTPVEKLERARENASGSPTESWFGDRPDDWSAHHPANWSESNVSAERVGTERVDGTEAYVVRVTHDSDRVNATATLWVSTDDYRVLEGRLVDGDHRVVVRFTELRFDVSVHESTFRPPDDREAVRDATRYDSLEAVRADTDLAVPSVDGYEFVDAARTRYGRAPVVVQRYRGPTNLTVTSTTLDSLPFEPDDARTVTVDGTDATVVELRDRTIVYWTQDGVTYAVAGDLSAERLVEIARDL